MTSSGGYEAVRNPSSDHARAQRMYDDDPLRYANEASDHGWSVITGFCGGCGEEECHPGETCRGGHCDHCPTRAAQGFPQRPTAPMCPACEIRHDPPLHYDGFVA